MRFAVAHCIWSSMSEKAAFNRSCEVPPSPEHCDLEELRNAHPAIGVDLRFGHISFRCVAGERLRGRPPNEEGAAVQVRQRYLIIGIAMTLTPVAVAVASPASADCSGQARPEPQTSYPRTH
jgi:hypothetical protein